MVSRLSLIVILGCLICSGWAQAEPLLTVKVNKKSSLLGEPVLVEINAVDMPVSLITMNMDKLKQDFNIFSISSNVQSQKLKGRARKIETMSLTLYPRHTGKLRLPALGFHGKQSKAAEIVITEANKQMQQVIIKTATDIPNPVVRQAFTLTLEIIDDGSRQWTAPAELAATGFYQHRLAETQGEELVDGVRYTVHRYAWSLMPLREGRLKVEFPLLDAFIFGERLRYPVSSLQMVAAPVPTYLPVHVPIGKLEVKLEPMPAEIALNRPVNLELSIKGSGISAEGVAKLLSSIHGNESIHFYPLTINFDNNSRATTAAQLLRVTIPFAPLRTGKVSLPEIILPYYDPEGARVQSVLIPGAGVVVFNPLWRNVRVIVLTLMVLAGLSVAGYQVYKYLRRFMQKRRCLRAIQLSGSAEVLSKGLMKLGVEDSLQPPHTLQQWLLYLQKSYEIDERLPDLLQQLDNVQYGDKNTGIDITSLSDEFVNILRQLPLKKIGGNTAEDISLLQALYRQPVKLEK
jgi:hypothetical protein